MDRLKKCLSKHRQLIDSRLHRMLPRTGVRPRFLHRAMRYSIFSGGKRLRPIITIESCRLCGGRAEDAIEAACAVEMVHTFSLIHDDLPAMDNDDYRRGRLACHKRFSEATAILAGDALLTEAFGVLAAMKNKRQIERAVKELSKTLGSLGMAGGQEEDLRKRGSVKKDDLDFIIKNKTAALFKTSAALGVICAGADRKTGKSVSAFGVYLGTAFQLIDDTFDNDGYVLLAGMKNTKKKIAQFIKKAKDALRPFGPRADNLVNLADFIAQRKR